MDSESGRLMNMAQCTEEQISKMTGDARFVQVQESDMTAKQKETMQVSKHDSRSKLGILRRKVQKGIGRNSPCPCGSGVKFKKCCMLSG